ncbi:T9SS type A sorting domain-containing protein [Hymenobacter jeollabukensis]|uniref:T9SS type A sorting domain-containing protein n=1 Tax=Hymenobacter jeollabukensis TaxID=2025313 RepID=A0A5R8WLP9_9BACT|nr:T9SS type A sorting domain-containing protein [Hymenobacter jeollabukensis]TLM90095.1 T9SS type A sorting domain-containing protein [Hymenobacter jeollabukensis]
MKRLLLSLALLAGAATAALAQSAPVPNGGFETWTGAGATERPQNWQNTDDLLQAAFPIPITVGAVTKTTDAHGGNFAARLETKVINLFSTPILYPGMLILGNRISTSTSPGGTTDGAGMPFTSRPQALQCHYKLTGSNIANDSASVLVFLTRRVNGRSTILALGEAYLLQEKTSYTQLQVPLQYISNQAPDSIHIIAFSGALDDSNLTAGNVLTIDDFTTVGSAVTAARDAQRSPELAAFPNPSPDGIFTLDARRDAALLRAPFTVTDALGRTVLRQGSSTSTAPRRIDLSGQPAGVYVLRLSGPQGAVTRRLVVQ